MDLAKIRLIKELSIEMDLAKIRLIRKAVIKERGAAVFWKNPPAPHPIQSPFKY
jgi:hypothetical protein